MNWSSFSFFSSRFFNFFSISFWSFLRLLIFSAYFWMILIRLSESTFPIFCSSRLTGMTFPRRLFGLNFMSRFPVSSRVRLKSCFSVPELLRKSCRRPCTSSSDEAMRFHFPRSFCYDKSSRVVVTLHWPMSSRQVAVSWILPSTSSNSISWSFPRISHWNNSPLMFLPLKGVGFYLASILFYLIFDDVG